MTIAYRRLNPSLPADIVDFQLIFRATPSFVFATKGREPTDAEIVQMMKRITDGRHSEDVFIYAISEGGQMRACSVTVRGYPRLDVAFLALLLVVETAQGKALGPQILRKIEAEARFWGCSSISAAVDSENHRAFRFWLREGFVERNRKTVKGFVGQAIAIEKTGYLARYPLLVR